MSILETQTQQLKSKLHAYENQEFLIWSRTRQQYMVYWDAANPDAHDFTDSTEEAEAYNFEIALKICFEANQTELVLLMVPVK